MKSEKLNRAKLFRKLHGVARQIYEIDNPHPILHQLAVSEFEVESMSELSADQINTLIEKVMKSEVNWNKVEALGVTRVPEMGYKQQYLVKKLQKELGWSDEYMYELTIQRYGFLDWKYLSGRQAWAFVNYLIRRKKQKSKKGKEVA